MVKSRNISQAYTNLIQRSKHLNKKLIKYLIWAPNKLKTKLKKSFIKNFKIDYKSRISLNVRTFYFTKQKQFYNSQNKLQCFLSYNFSVPNKRVNTSRFYLNKGIERLIFGGYQK